jgi:hypothetical protein
MAVNTYANALRKMHRKLKNYKRKRTSKQLGVTAIKRDPKQCRMGLFLIQLNQK